jgi:hypothetical protein
MELVSKVVLVHDMKTYVRVKLLIYMLTQQPNSQLKISNKTQQDMECTYNVTSRRVRVTIVAIEEQ